jgi:hypothetical protein
VESRFFLLLASYTKKKKTRIAPLDSYVKVGDFCLFSRASQKLSVKLGLRVVPKEPL